jgi:hypothetical protein
MITLRMENFYHNIEGFAPEPPEFVALSRQMKLLNLQRSGRPILDRTSPSFPWMPRRSVLLSSAPILLGTKCNYEHITTTESHRFKK